MTAFVICNINYKILHLTPYCQSWVLIAKFWILRCTHAPYRDTYFLSSKKLNTLHWKQFKKSLRLQVCNTKTLQNTCAYEAFHEESGGVSEFFQVETAIFMYLSPLTPFLEANDSSSTISSGVNLTDKVPMFWLKFSILVVPGMGHTSFPWWWTQANASCDEVHPFLAASSLTRSNMVLLCSKFSGKNLGKYCKHWLHTSVLRLKSLNNKGNQ